MCQLLPNVVLAAGGYDHTVKVWDVRSKSCVMSFDHGAPVEDLTYFASGGLLVSAGGTNLCVWDLLRCASLSDWMVVLYVPLL